MLCHAYGRPIIVISLLTYVAPALPKILVLPPDIGGKYKFFYIWVNCTLLISIWKYKLQGGTLISIKKFIMALFKKIDSKREVKFTSSAWKLTSPAWKWYYSFSREIFSFGEIFRSKDFFKNCGPHYIRGPN